MKKAVLIRLDKIGDLICTLPMDQAPALQGWDVTWIVAKGLSFVPENALPARKFIELDKSGRSATRKEFDRFLREYSPDLAISFQAPWWVHYALWKNRVRRRIGVLSKWHSFLFLNEGLRQKRSRSEKHEAAYNLDLVNAIGPAEKLTAVAPVLELRAPEEAGLLSTFGLSPKNYDVVHPGMAGSALNWPIPHYIQLIQSLIKTRPVVLTGTPADESWLTEIKTVFKDEPKVLCLQNKLKTTQLLRILADAHQVFAPSTGVLHLAASLNTRSVGFYSPVLVQRAKRWGARGPHTHLYTPDVPCPATHQCHGEACPFYYCLNRITPEQILQENP